MFASIKELSLGCDRLEESNTMGQGYKHKTLEDFRSNQDIK
jgi:hypothetical protein